MVRSRVIIRVTPIRALIALLITYLLSPLPLQVVSAGIHSSSDDLFQTSPLPWDPKVECKASILGVTGIIWGSIPHNST